MNKVLEIDEVEGVVVVDSRCSGRSGRDGHSNHSGRSEIVFVIDVVVAVATTMVQVDEEVVVAVALRCGGGTERGGQIRRARRNGQWLK